MKNFSEAVQLFPVSRAFEGYQEDAVLRGIQRGMRSHSGGRTYAHLGWGSFQESVGGCYEVGHTLLG